MGQQNCKNASFNQTGAISTVNNDNKEQMLDNDTHSSRRTQGTS
jgi:hypothetical protein